MSSRHSATVGPGEPIAATRGQTGRTVTPFAARYAFASPIVNFQRPVEDRCCEHCVCATVECPVDEILQPADPARSDNGDVDGVDDRPRQAQVEAIAGAVSVHRGQQDLTCAVPCALDCPCRRRLGRPDGGPRV